MTRTTKGELDQLVVVLNNRLGRPQYQWDRVNGQNVCRVGALTLDRAYGGTRLHEVVNGGGGVREVSPRLPSGQMATFLRAVLQGIDFAEANVGNYGSLPAWSQPTMTAGDLASDVLAQAGPLPRKPLRVEDVWS